MGCRNKVDKKSQKIKIKSPENLRYSNRMQLIFLLHSIKEFQNEIETKLFISFFIFWYKEAYLNNVNKAILYIKLNDSNATVLINTKLKTYFLVSQKYTSLDFCPPLLQIPKCSSFM